MGKLIYLVTPLHKKTHRDYLARMADDKVYCMKVARQYEKEYWDGDRRFGYGGYTYDGRWKPIAQKLIKRYKLKTNAKILDVGCGKAHLLYELKKLLPKAEIVGFDISTYGIRNAPNLVKPFLKIHKAQNHYPYPDKYFDLTISLMTLHNLHTYELEAAVREIERVGKQKYLLVESWRNEAEFFNLECWALTANLILTPQDWIWLYRTFGYTGDYEFLYFE